MDKDMERKEWLLAQVSQYIEENYEGFSYYAPRPCHELESLCEVCEIEDDFFSDIFKIFAADHSQSPYEHVFNYLNKPVEETFTEYMLRVIAEKGYDETDVYHNVFMDRKLFNKIRNDPLYQPSKRTALLIAIALRLTIPETQELLGKAGFVLTHCSKTDLIVEFCIQQGIYDIFEINELLDAFHLPLLMKCD